MPMKKIYQSPRVDLVRLETACTLLEGSVTTNDIPDVDVVDFNWGTL